jgi:hypothetical protein
MDWLFKVGVALAAAAVVGGGLKMGGVEVPILKSLARQLALLVLGIAFIVYGRGMFVFPGYYETDRGGAQHVASHNFEPTCRRIGTTDSVNHCTFTRSQIACSGTTLCDEWDIIRDAPGPVYEVACVTTAGFEHVKLQVASGNSGHCHGDINGGDGDIIMTVKWKEWRWW